jgi:hypothetical protein
MSPTLERRERGRRSTNKKRKKKTEKFNTQEEKSAHSWRTFCKS